MVDTPDALALEALKSESVFAEYLFLAEQRPGMFFGSYRLVDVHSHLSGWNAHRSYHSDDDRFSDRFFKEFDGFVADHFKDERTVGWAVLISENVNGARDEFPAFMKLFRAFAVADVAGSN